MTRMTSCFLFLLLVDYLACLVGFVKLLQDKRAICLKAEAGLETFREVDFLLWVARSQDFSRWFTGCTSNFFKDFKGHLKDSGKTTLLFNLVFCWSIFSSSWDNKMFNCQAADGLQTTHMGFLMKDMEFAKEPQCNSKAKMRSFGGFGGFRWWSFGGTFHQLKHLQFLAAEVLCNDEQGYLYVLESTRCQTECWWRLRMRSDSRIGFSVIPRRNVAENVDFACCWFLVLSIWFFQVFYQSCALDFESWFQGSFSLKAQCLRDTQKNEIGCLIDGI